MYPEGYRYTKDHEWIAVEGDRGKVGITDYAVGDEQQRLPVAAGEQFGTVESVKAVSELYSPVAGEVVEVNAPLADKPETVNQDPHGAAWMIVLKLESPEAVASLMDAAAYAALVASEAK